MFDNKIYNRLALYALIMISGFWFSASCKHGPRHDKFNAFYKEHMPDIETLYFMSRRDQINGRCAYYGNKLDLGPLKTLDANRKEKYVSAIKRLGSIDGVIFESKSESMTIEIYSIGSAVTSGFTWALVRWKNPPQNLVTDFDQNNLEHANFNKDIVCVAIRNNWYGVVKYFI